MSVHPDGFYVTLIGDMMRDENNRQVLDLRLEQGTAVGTPIVQGYPRTSHAAFGDLTGNGLTDVVISGFGDFGRGRFAWLENRGDGDYREHVLLDHAGALEVESHDGNPGRAAAGLPRFADLSQRRRSLVPGGVLHPMYGAIGGAGGRLQRQRPSGIAAIAFFPDWERTHRKASSYSSRPAASA